MRFSHTLLFSHALTQLTILFLFISFSPFSAFQNREVLTGMEKIRSKVHSLKLDGSHIEQYSVEAQTFKENSIVIVVTGRWTSPLTLFSAPFVNTFILLGMVRKTILSTPFLSFPVLSPFPSLEP